MGLTIVTAPTALCVTLAEFRLHCIEPVGQSDDLLTFFLTVASDWVQGRTNLQLMTATWLQTWDDFPHGSDDKLKIDIMPVQSISSVKHYDSAGTLTTLSSSTDYWSGLRSKPPKIVPQNTWPGVQLGRPEAVQVEFVAGYATAALVPDRAKLAVRQLAAYWLMQRPAVTVSESSEPSATTPAYGDIPFGVEALCQQIDVSGYT